MTTDRLIANHYTQGGLVNAIRDGVHKLGKTTDTVDINDLGPVDEFHIGGRRATRSFLDQLDLNASNHVLDVGCGLGGASRFAAQSYGCRVTGVDLTPEYIEAGNDLCDWVGLNELVTLQIANAIALPQPDHSFDQAYMLHVGMNIEHKGLLTAELSRVLKPGARFGIYDIMRMEEGDLAFPVPWATERDASFVASVATYETALEQSGFSILSKRNRRDFALEFFTQLRATASGANGPPPLGLHILMGSNASKKIENMVENIARNRIAPVEIVAEKRS